MNETRIRANQFILSLENKISTLSELEEFRLSLQVPGLTRGMEISNDLEIGVATSNFASVNDAPPQIERFHRVRLSQDLGITELQKTFRAMLLHDVETRIEEVEKEINNLIGDKNND